jgi:hypothetical protein
MPKKKLILEDEILDDNMEEMEDFEIVDEFSEISTDSDSDMSVSDSIEIEIEIDDEIVDEVIEIADEDLNLDPKEDQDDIYLSKHTIQGKHSLKYDSIFKGRKEDPLTEEDVEMHSKFSDNFEVDKSSMYWFESIDNENYIREKKLKEKVYSVLSDHTDLNFLNNRRKPSRTDFNHYYYLLKTHLQNENFTNIELFNELSVYFSDNLFNMFKLLDNKWRNLVIFELQNHIGKQNYSDEIMPRNIHLGTEVEFSYLDPTVGKILYITGVVIETDYDTSVYQVNSYEKIYEISIDDITKILNNTKFKYNLNKLNNIDFL